MNISDSFNDLSAGVFLIGLIIIAFNLFLLIKFIYLCSDIQKIRQEINRHNKEQEKLNNKLYEEIINNNKLLGILIRGNGVEKDKRE